MAGGIPNIARIGRHLGDFSRIRSPQKVPNRLFNRGVGWSAGKLVHATSSRYHVLGLIAVAEFFVFVKKIVAYRASSPVWLGSMVNYALWVDRGWTHPASGTQVAPVAYFTNAIKQAEAELTAFSGGYRLPRLAGAGASTETKVRTGIYEGQKFLGDLGQFYRDASIGGLAGRYVRRETGRQVSGFLFNSLKAKRNPMEKFAYLVIKHAKSNLQGHIRTGLLRSSLAMGPTEYDFMEASIKQARAYGAAHGMTDIQINRKLALTTSASGGLYAETKGQTWGAEHGIEMPE